MDIYASHSTIPGKPHHRDASYNYAQYSAEFGLFEQAFEAAGMPAGSIQGATYAGSKWYGEIGDYIKTHGSKLKTVSYHKYARSSCSGHLVTQADLLSYVAGEGSFSDAWKESAATIATANISFVIGEGNSISCGGTSGVSDTFPSALWVLDFLPWASKSGAAAMNFHGGPHGPYAAVSFASSTAAPVMNPMYYGLLAFSELVGNYSRWLPLNITGGGGNAGGGGAGGAGISYSGAGAGAGAGISRSAGRRDGMPTPTTTMVQDANDAAADPQCLHGIKSGLVCCAASCGICGGTTCAHEPGGPESCCGTHIERNNMSCTLNPAPCIIDETWGPKVISHATIDAHGAVKVLIVTKDLHATGATPVTVCLEQQQQQQPQMSNAGTEAAALADTATVAFLSAPKGASSKAGDGITWAGQTFDNTPDGTPQGTRSVTAIARNPPAAGASGQVCFDVAMPALSAAMLHVAPAPAYRT